MSNFITDWINFENEILYKNRFFNRNKMLQHIRDYAMLHNEILTENTELYRARIIPRKDILEDARRILGDKLNTDDITVRLKLYEELGIYGYNDEHSGMPPIEKTQMGRANPQFIPYFYVTKHPYTALAECKPYQFDNVSIARYLTTKQQKLVNFNFYSGKPYGERTYEDELAEHLNYNFSRPVKDTNKDYIVTQFIAEYIKYLGFDGICYSSSLHKNADNITLFTDSNCIFKGSYVYEIKDIIIETAPIKHNNVAPNINP